MSDAMKRNAALQALREEVQDGQVLGVGTGSTVAHFITELGKLVRKEGLEVLSVPSSLQTQSLCSRAGLRLATLEEHPVLDVTVDGADEIDPRLNLIKGGGAALTREKILATASRKLAIIADESKLVKRLGEKHPVPIEILPFSLGFVENQLRRFKPKKAELRLSREGKDGPVITDNGNLVLDLYLGAIRDPAQLAAELKAIPGVIEDGIFPGMTDVAYLGGARRVRTLR